MGRFLIGWYCFDSLPTFQSRRRQTSDVCFCVSIHSICVKMSNKRIGDNVENAPTQKRKSVRRLLQVPLTAYFTHSALERSQPPTDQSSDPEQNLINDPEDHAERRTSSNETDSDFNEISQTQTQQFPEEPE